MDSRLVILFALIVAVSGCSQLPTGPNNDDKQQEGKGLEVIEFRVSDNTLQPGQKATLMMNLRNYHTEEIEILNNTILNSGSLVEVSNKDCSPEQIERAQQGIYPEMECTWDLEAAAEDEIGDFNSRTVSMNAFLQYNSSLTLINPLQLDFREYDNIESTERISRGFSNGEVEGSLSVENPVSIRDGRQIDVSVTEVGEGRVTSPYTFEFFPESPQVWYGCENGQQEEPIVGEEVEFSCTVDYDTETTHNLLFSTYYKYAKEPTINIEIVNN